MHISKSRVNQSLDKQIKLFLFDLISQIKDTDEAKKIFSDLLTLEELEIISKRLAIGYFIKSNRSYENICINLKVSTTTIASISKKIESEGFNLALKKIGAYEWSDKWGKRKIKRVNG